MSTPKERRQIIISQMNQISKKGINCQGCVGTCCTSLANSMQISPLEAQDLLDFLKSSGRLTTQLKEDLLDCVKKYRLDHEISTTRGIPFRRTYTCPFFTPGPKGCSIDPEYKPYGCLSFNPQEKNANGGSSCFSNSDIYQKREDEFIWKEGGLNKKIIEGLNLSWNKKSIPQALLDLWNSLH